MKKPLKILMVEDNLFDAELIRLELRKINKDFESRIVQDEKNFLNELETFQPDLILSGYTMPQFTGLDALDIAKKKCPEIPFIIVTGTLNDEIAVKCIRWGAWDYVLKDRLVHLGHAVKNAIKLKAENEKKKLAEDALRESEKRFKDISFSMADWIWEVDEKGVYTYCSDKVQNVLGYSVDEIIGKTPFDFMDHEEAEKIKNIFKQILEQKKPIKDLENWNINKDDRKICLLTNGIPILDENGNITGYRGVDKDITERKKAEDIQKTLFNISNALNTTDNMPDLYSKIREFLGDVIDTTNFYVALYDEKTDMISLPFDVDEKDEFETFPAGKTLTKYVIKTGKPLFASMQFQNELVKQGKIEIIGTRSEIWLGAPLKIENKVIGVIAVQSYDDPNLYTEKDIEILTFVSEEIALAFKHKQADEQIKRDLEEKGILLQEIHHRVKNNMQIISSLLKLQSAHIKDKRTLELFQNSRDRVKTMSLIHDALYRSKDLAHIDFADYVRKLATQIFISYGANSNFIKLKIDIKDVLLDISTAIPCGLIINELVSNSLKYAFPEGKGEIGISFTYNNKVNTLCVKDNGIGISGKINLENSSTLGLLLVNSLTKQLDGTLKLEKVKGTSFKIAFKKTELKTYGKVES